MKNKFLLLGLLFSFSSFAQNVLINGDFSNGLSSWEQFSCCGPTVTFNADNGEANMINIANTNGTTWQIQLFQALTAGQIGQLTIGTNYKISFDARSNVNGRTVKMFFGENGGGFAAVSNTDFVITDQMESYEVIFTMSATYGAMKCGFEMGQSNNPVWIDNVVLEPFVGLVAPPQPTGFVANNQVNGNPVGSGEVFLACGGNQAGVNNVVYQLFYAPTASAPVDPTTATQHPFGTIAGDNGGNGAFGFVLGGLTAGTEYTFWLYQYNTSTMLYSTPAIATVVSGGTLGGPIVPAQPVGFVANNNSVGPGEAFLACGPNNTANADITYQLFYSPTATAPVDPLTASQYTFGTTAGDGGGNGAFGFTITGLAISTNYTFWLYQYNSVEMTYSTPAIATVQSGSNPPPPPATPTTNAPNPTCPVGDVVSIYGDHYPTNIATNYNPNWGQSGSVNPSFNPGTGNPILAYTNFNYQGTVLTQTDLSAMEFLTFDIWTEANPSATTIQVSPINQGGVAEVLVTIPYTQGQWTKIELHKSLFTGMTWNAVKELKFAANGPGSTVPVDIYLDNIFFSTCGTPPPPPPAATPSTNAANPTCPETNVVSIYGDHYPTNIATNYNPNWGQSGSVNPNFDPGTGNPVLAYTNFNYQGTLLNATNLSNMEFLRFDVYTAANPSSTILQVSPINQGTGTAEFLVTVPYVQGQWTTISLPKSAFTGMTWDNVFQLKFAANGPGSTVPANIYLDNIYFSDDCQVPVTTQLRAIDCGATNVPMNQILRAIQVGAPNYRFRVSGANNGGPGWNNNQFIYDTPNGQNHFRFQFIPGAAWGATYAVEVAVGDGAGNYGPYGNSCNVTLENQITTQITAATCGATVTMDNFVQADWAPGAVGYRFRIQGANNGGAGWSGNTFIYETTAPVRSFKFNNHIPGALFGETYSIDVAVLSGDNVWLPYGSACNVTIATPSTQIQASQCGATGVALPTSILADNVVGASGYRFRITGANSANWMNNQFILNRPNRVMQFQMVAGVLAGEVYQIEVAVMDANGNYGAYGAACNITIEGAPSIVINDENDLSSEREIFMADKSLVEVAFGANASHNPFTTEFGIQVLNANDTETINVVIYDMSGKLIERNAVNPMGIEAAKFGSNLASGMYMIEVRQGSNQAVIRQVKN